MESLRIAGTEVSPEINFDISSNIFSISGMSRPENSGKFYSQVCNWLSEYEKVMDSENPLNTAQPIVFKFKMEYFNSISAKYISDIILILKELVVNGVPVNIEWHYPKFDDDMLDIGHEFADMVELEFYYTPC